MIGDYITEVNGLDTGATTFGALLPTDKEVPLKLRFSRFSCKVWLWEGVRERGEGWGGVVVYNHKGGYICCVARQ